MAKQFQKYKGYGKGWHFHSFEHSLASKGIPSKSPRPKLSAGRHNQRSLTPSTDNEPFSVVLSAEGIKITQDIPNVTLSPSKRNAFYSFIDKHFKKKIAETKDPEKKEALQKAHEEAKQIKRGSHLKEWLKKHKTLLITTGLMGALLIGSELAGAGTTVINNATGQIRVIGATTLGTILETAGIGAEAVAYSEGLADIPISEKEKEIEEEEKEGKITHEEEQKEIAKLESERPLKHIKKWIFGAKGKIKFLYYCNKCGEFSQTKRCDFCGSKDTYKSIRDNSPPTRLEHYAMQDRMMGKVLKKNIKKDEHWKNLMRKDDIFEEKNRVDDISNKREVFISDEDRAMQKNTEIRPEPRIIEENRRNKK